MQMSRWALTALLFGLFYASFLQAAPIGPRTTGSVGILTASAQVSYRVGTGGSCGFGPVGDPYPGSAIASIRSTSAIVANLPSSGCGACIQLTCADQGVCNADAVPVTVTVIDSCSSCSSAITSFQFSKLAPTNVGSVAVQLQQVDCTPPGNIEIRVLEFRPFAGGYLKITPWQTAGVAAVSKIEYKQSSADDSSFQAFRNTYGAVWEASVLPSPPLDIRLTDAAGHTVIARRVTPTAAADIPTGVQFPLSVPAASPSPAPVPVSPSPSPALPSPSPVLPPPSPVPPVLPPPVPPSPGPVLPLPSPIVPPALPPVISSPPPVPPALPPVLPPRLPLRPPLPPPILLPPAVLPPVPSAPPPSPAIFPAAPVVQPPIVGPVALPPLVTSPVAPPFAPSPIPPVPLPSPVQVPPPVVAIPPVAPPPSPAVQPPSPAPVVPPAAQPTAPVPAPVPVPPAIPPSPIGPCQNVLQILQSNPSLSTWLSVLQDLGQAVSLGNDRLNITMFAPLNSAFDAPLPAGSNLGTGTAGQLLTQRPELKSPIAGYHVVAGAFLSSALTPGTSLPTVDVERTPGQPDRPVILNVTAPLKLQGVGSSTNIVQPDLKTCGPSVVHVIDAVLLPFNPASGPAPGG